MPLEHPGHLRLDGHERVLYRTHTVILTDKRIVVDGNTYPLWQIEAIHTTRARYHLPLLAVRLAVVALLAVGLATSDGLYVRFGFLLVMGALLFGVMYLVPTHVLQIDTPGGRVRVMSSGDTGYLKDVAAQIACARDRVAR